MSQPVVSIDKFKGIVNAADVIRAGDADNGVLTQARNVVVDNTGMILTDGLLGGMTKDFSMNQSDPSAIQHGGSYLTTADNVINFTDAFTQGTEYAAYNFIAFDSTIRMMVSVEDGVWVSDVSNIYFLRGTDMTTVNRVKVANYGVIRGSVVEINGSDMKDDLELTGKAVMVTTLQGICVCGKGGFFKNLTQGRYNIPLGINTVTAAFNRYDTINLYTITIT